ncbi:adrenodoxin-like [Clavelina lepadiformis]|uniref:2Fe-2S ferredoxin-type domain-containing protein n=1 Tax=Clavelina lepadiformis TaxID=159417 RepID=A0ABP0G5V8_CLALP
MYVTRCLLRSLSLKSSEMCGLSNAKVQSHGQMFKTTSTQSLNSITEPINLIKMTSRCFSKRNFHFSPELKNNKVNIKFVDRYGKLHEAKATVGDTLLDVVIDNDLNFESYGVCEGTISCSTCHVILDQATFDKLEEPLMDEYDMLDLACGLTDTSRLGCQVHVTREMEGVTFTLPIEITDARGV